MSAIAGVVARFGKPVERETFYRIRNLLVPYGRDAQDSLMLSDSAFCRTLMRTTPEDRYDRQPIHDPGSGLVFLFDGRIDNREEVRRALGWSKERLEETPDSLLVKESLLVWRENSPLKLLGDYAFAAWYTRSRRLLLARDPMGSRPLFWYQDANYLVFSSMPKAIFAVPGVERQLDEQAIEDELCLVPHSGPSSFYRNVQRVEPGHVVVFQDGKVRSEQFHRFKPEHKLKLAKDEDYVAGLEEQFERAVSVRLRADGQIAAELSSGLDSGAVVSFAAPLLATQGRDLLAYTAVPAIGFEAGTYKGYHLDEGPGARSVAAMYPNVRHELLPPCGESPLRALAEFIEQTDRAPLNLCNVMWSNMIARRASASGARVLLGAGMGNMTLSYDGLTLLPELFASGRWLRLWREIKGLKGVYRKRSLGWMIGASVAPFLPGSFWKWLESKSGRDFNLEDYSAIRLDPGLALRVRTRLAAVGWHWSHRPAAHGPRHRIATLRFTDIGQYNMGREALGVSPRDPTADLRLAEYCLSVPDSQYLRDGQQSWLVRRMLHGRLPRSILGQRTKGKQAADWHQTFGANLPELEHGLKTIAAHDFARQALDVVKMRSDLESWREGNPLDSRTELRLRIKLLRGIAVGSFIRHVLPDNSDDNLN